MRAECSCRLGQSLALPRTPSPILRITQRHLRTRTVEYGRAAIVLVDHRATCARARSALVDARFPEPARADANFQNFFQNFLSARRADKSRAPSTCDVAQEAQSHHDGYIAESLEKKGLKLHSLLKLSAFALRSKVYSSIQ